MIKNRYTLARKMSNFITDMTRKHGITENVNAPNIKIAFEKHLPDRIIDREISLRIMSKFILAIARDKTCEIIYLSTLYPNKRIQLYYQGYMCGISGKMTENGNFFIKIRTIYEDRKNRDREIECFEIHLDDSMKVEEPEVVEENKEEE